MVTINDARFAVNRSATGHCVLMRREFDDDCARSRRLGLLIYLCNCNDRCVSTLCNRLTFRHDDAAKENCDGVRLGCEIIGFVE